MEQGLSISIVIHLIFMVFLFWVPWEGSQNSLSGPSMVSLLSSKQQSQRQRMKGSKKKKKVIKDKTGRQPTVTQAQPLGHDKQSAPAVRGGLKTPNTSASLSYAQELQSFIAKNRYYPRKAIIRRQTGIVKIAIKINARGRFTKVRLVQSSPHEVLNSAALEFINELQSFKPLPKAYRGNGEFIVPIRYNLNVRLK